MLAVMCLLMNMNFDTVGWAAGRASDL